MRPPTRARQLSCAATWCIRPAGDIDGRSKPNAQLARDESGDLSRKRSGRRALAAEILDGIPALYFLPSYTVGPLVTCVKRLIEMFYPRLVLGISDEIPPDGDIERVRLVGELVKELI
jgi:hypothetical protein